MSVPYLLLSDLHFHSWSAFGGRDADGVSTRLRIIMNEFERAAEELKKAGGKCIVLAGDIFHVRGAIHPEVFNPVYEMFKKLSDDDFRIYAIPGNHDLATKETTKLGNAIQTLGALKNVDIITKTAVLFPDFEHQIVLLPWMSNNDALRVEIKSIKKNFKYNEYDLIIHTGINGVLTGLPDHGLDASEVVSWGFKRVFSGHYHNHKVFEGGKVISIGASTAQTWSDIGTKSGFLLVYPDRVEWKASHAPGFIEVTDETDPDDLPFIVDGNYVRVRGTVATDAEINEMREKFINLGARGFSYQGIRDTSVVRTTSGAHKAVSIEESVGEYIKDKKFDPADEEAIIKDSLDILSTVRSKSE
jgi:DNA repair exonuclease SbcCD nuclease subunit